MNWLSRIFDLILWLESPEVLKIYDQEILNRKWSWMMLRRQDPTVTEDLWEQRMIDHADRVWRALRAGEPQRIRALVSDGLYQSLLAQQQIGRPFEFISDGRLPIGALNLDVIQQDGPYAVAIARPYWHRHPTHRTKSWAVGAKWFYIRRMKGVRPGVLGAHGLWESCCPQCGVDLDLADRVRCDQCGTIVNSGEHDWILCAISDGDHEYETFRIPGLSVLRRRDPVLVPELIEDRAAAIFWAMRRAELGDHAALTGFLAEGFSPSLDARQGTPFLEDIRMQGAQPGESEDRIVLRVRWRDGETACVERWTLTRDASALTPIHRGLNSLGCQGCGAPLERGECGYCGARQQVRNEWTLADVGPHELDPESRSGLFTIDLSGFVRSTIYGVLHQLDRTSGAVCIIFRRDVGRVFGLGKSRMRVLYRPVSAAKRLQVGHQELLLDLAFQMFIDTSEMNERCQAALHSLGESIGKPREAIEQRIKASIEIHRRVIEARAACEARKAAAKKAKP